MKQKTKKITTIALTGILLCSSVVPSMTYASTLSNKANIYKEFSNNLEDILIKDGVSQKEWNDYIKFVKNGVGQESTERGVGSTVKKALKYILKHLDVIPSKTLRDYLKKYGGKIIDVIDTIDTWTWYGIANALIAIGVPDHVADAIADFIVTFLL